MSKVRLGFVGVGGMGQCAHLRNYVANPDCEVVALAELREGLGSKVAARYGIPKVYQDHKQLLASEKLDGIVAVQWFGVHARTIPELFAAGVPVLTEKPIARSTVAAERIIGALQASKARYFVAYHKRSDPATMYVKEKIEAWKQSGEVGAMKYVRITMPPGDWAAQGFAHLITTDEKQSPTDPDPAQPGLDAAAIQQYDGFVNYYIHQVNLMRHLMGQGYKVSYADPAGVVILVHGDNGLPGTLELAPYSTTRDWQEVALVGFDKGWIRLELPAPMAIDRPGRVTVYHDPGQGVTPTQTEPTLPWVHAMRQQAANFIRAIRGEKTPLCEGAEALEDLKIAEQYIRQLLAARK